MTPQPPPSWTCPPFIAALPHEPNVTRFVDHLTHVKCNVARLTP